MRLCGLLLIASLVWAATEVSSHGIDPVCQKEDTCHEEEYFICEKADGQMIQNCSVLECENSTLPESFCNFPLTQISCNVYKSNQLNCSWNTHMLPKGAQYSAFYNSCTNEEENTNQPLHCFSNSGRERVECHVQINNTRYEKWMVEVHVSIPSHSLILCKPFLHADIEMLEPPKNITAFIESNSLKIKWSPPKEAHDIYSDCFDYELNINNHTVMIPGVSEYTRKNIDLTMPYSIKIRAKWNVCAPNKHWSDWSEIMVVDQSEKKPYPLNWYVIVSIAFVLPMILLAIILVCKFQRLSQKLFPSIPGPSVKVKMLLERDDFGQVMPPKQGGSEAEEGTDILRVRDESSLEEEMKI